MRAITDLHLWQPHSTVTVIINCGTKWITSLALASALRCGRYPTLIVDCESSDGSRAHFMRLARHAGWEFAWLEWPLRAHGATLDQLFQEINVPRVLLLDSDAVIVSSDVVDAVVAALDAKPSAYGAGFLQRQCWLMQEHGVQSGVGLYRERMWIPFVLLRVSHIREALAAGVSFAYRRQFVEFPGHPLLSRALACRFWLPILRSAKPPRRTRVVPEPDPGQAAAKFLEYDTGALVHEWLCNAEHSFAALDAMHWSKIEHEHGITRANMTSRLRKLTNVAGLTRNNAAGLQAAQRRAMTRLADDYGIDVASLCRHEDARTGI